MAPWGSGRERSLDGLMRRRQQGAWKALPGGSSPPCGDRSVPGPPRWRVIMVALLWGVSADAGSRAAPRRVGPGASGAPRHVAREVAGLPQRPGAGGGRRKRSAEAGEAGAMGDRWGAGRRSI